MCRVLATDPNVKAMFVALNAVPRPISGDSAGPTANGWGNLPLQQQPKIFIQFYVRGTFSLAACTKKAKEPTSVCRNQLVFPSDRSNKSIWLSCPPKALPLICRMLQSFSGRPNQSITPGQFRALPHFCCQLESRLLCKPFEFI
jgi:hypothetical protein